MRSGVSSISLSSVTIVAELAVEQFVLFFK